MDSLFYWYFIGNVHNKDTVSKYPIVTIIKGLNSVKHSEGDILLFEETYILSSHSI